MSDKTWVDYVVPCPRCRRDVFVPYDTPADMRSQAIAHNVMLPALSHADNATSVCSPCGTDEAMQEFAGQTLAMPSEWPVDRSTLTDSMNDAATEFVRMVRERTDENA
jgi:hypothetical protein